MPKRTSNYREQFLKDLLDPVEAACYLSAAIEDSEEDAFILALRDVAEAHQLSRVANEAGMASRMLKN